MAPVLLLVKLFYIGSVLLPSGLLASVLIPSVLLEPSVLLPRVLLPNILPQVEPYMALREAPHLQSTIHGAIFRELQEAGVLFGGNQLGFSFLFFKPGHGPRSQYI